MGARDFLVNLDGYHPFGNCTVCGEAAIGSHFGGTPHLCQKHFNEKCKNDYASSAEGEAVKAIADKYNCSVEAAKVILRK